MSCQLDTALNSFLSGVDREGIPLTGQLSAATLFVVQTQKECAAKGNSEGLKNTLKFTLGHGKTL